MLFRRVGLGTEDPAMLLTSEDNNWAVADAIEVFERAAAQCSK
jgi:hypothetical protein